MGNVICGWIDWPRGFAAIVTGWLAFSKGEKKPGDVRVGYGIIGVILQVPTLAGSLAALSQD